VTALEYNDIPAAVVEKAKACIIDTIANRLFKTPFLLPATVSPVL
jgi:2-methylcitrate dehydratase PrpD